MACSWDLLSRNEGSIPSNRGTCRHRPLINRGGVERIPIRGRLQRLALLLFLLLLPLCLGG